MALLGPSSGKQWKFEITREHYENYRTAIETHQAIIEMIATIPPHLTIGQVTTKWDRLSKLINDERYCESNSSNENI
jgi:hypothetical protein